MKSLTRRSMLAGAAAAGAAALGVSAVAGEPQDKKPSQQPSGGPAVPGKTSADDQSLRQLFAVVDGDGTLRRGQHVAKVAYLGRGQYEVIFKRDVQRGVFQATIGDNSQDGVTPTGFVSVQCRSARPRAVRVATSDSQGMSVDMGFHLLVLCPSGDA
jgi:hypothetical protein